MTDDLRLKIMTALTEAAASLGTGHSYTALRQAGDGFEMLRDWCREDQAARLDEDAA